MLRDQLGEIVDVIGYNEYFGWYYAPFFVPQFQVDEKTVRDRTFPLMQDIRFRNAFGKPMVISESGGAKYGKRSDRAVLWSEEYQLKYTISSTCWPAAVGPGCEPPISGISAPCAT